MDAQAQHDYCHEIGRAILAGCKRHGVSLEALDHLIGSEGNETMDAITLLIEADHHASLVSRINARSLQDGSSVELRDVVLVPDYYALGITRRAKERCDLNILGQDFKKWDYLEGADGAEISGRGKCFEVLTWKPGRDISSDDVRKYFQEKGFYGHTAAFVTWITQHSPEGNHATVPEDNACWHDASGRLFFPVSFFSSNRRELDHHLVEKSWRGNWCFVAFREL